MHLDTPMHLAQIRIDDLRRTAPRHRFPTISQTRTRTRTRTHRISRMH